MTAFLMSFDVKKHKESIEQKILNLGNKQKWAI